MKTFEPGQSVWVDTRVLARRLPQKDDITFWKPAVYEAWNSKLMIYCHEVRLPGTIVSYVADESILSEADYAKMALVA